MSKPVIITDESKEYGYLTVYLKARAALAGNVPSLTPTQALYLKAWARKRRSELRRFKSLDFSGSDTASADKTDAVLTEK